MKKIKKLLELILLFILTILYKSLIMYLINKLGFAIVKNEIANIIIDLSLIFIIWIIYRKSLKKDLKDFKTNYNKYLKFGLKYWLIGVAIMIISNFIILLFIKEGPKNEEIVLDILKALPIYTIFSACIYAPFIEEILYRKKIKELFKSPVLYILISGLAFGFMHTLANYGNPSELLYIIPYGIVGCMFAYIYYKTNNIFTSISFHLIHNLITITLSILFILSIGVGI